MTEREALKLALEKFEFMNHVDSIFEGEFNFQINAIKEALAQPEQEQVEWGVDWGPDGNSVSIIKRLADGGIEVVGWEYAPHPPQRKPLSEEEIGAILEDVNAYGTRLYTFARAIEAAHGIKEKNNG
jgi:hypothetical protein